ncbi:DUF86 domain-containing protein [Peptacetobacter hiranonis]|uniref:Putative toxin-antitoxin system, antitoxin component n=1 Tax=Peptacetobacter hiranonis (strain DSM 13275 / JCM 10541 / KCTC 15199 / TO-931) TaxID=500633 RepID=B6FY28_PEPHT|nr:HepT-like ribonuclease domain-containing protein [Peptacetobacter hiranonis]EEA85575.1 putative toxin-antitoxin system, antitoxin component [Peptacetobacter hiranonis DSM 13275]QEK20079.1 hypothetical protein KGNDJEFE_00560 [Peptacetobacter hiranonis]
MDNKKGNEYYLKKVITDLEFVVKHTENINKYELEENEILVDSVMFRLIQISENANKLSDEFKQNYAFIPWRAIKGMRNKIVHDYGSVDLGVVYDTVKEDIPELLRELKESFD